MEVRVSVLQSNSGGVVGLPLKQQLSDHTLKVAADEYTNG
jgi:hypothetical protein